MSGEQRAEVDAIMRAPQPVPRDLAEMRANFAARQALSTIPEAVRTSAGGGLVVTAVMKARERGLPAPAAIIAFLGEPRPDPQQREHERQGGHRSDLQARDAEAVLAMYCHGEDVHQPLLSPALTADLTGFPPTLLYMTPLGWRPCPAGNRAARTD